MAETDRGYRVEVGDATGELAQRDLVTATAARLPQDHPLDPRLRDALACLA